MLKNLAACWAILLGIGFMMLANGLQGTLLGVRAGIEGFSTFSTGVMVFRTSSRRTVRWTPGH